MARWIMIGLTVCGFILAFMAKGPGLLGIGILCVFVGLIGSVFIIAGERVAANMRSEMDMLSAEDLAALRSRNTARTANPPNPSSGNSTP